MPILLLLCSQSSNISLLFFSHFFSEYKLRHLFAEPSCCGTHAFNLGSDARRGFHFPLHPLHSALFSSFWLHIKCAWLSRERCRRWLLSRLRQIIMKSNACRAQCERTQMRFADASLIIASNPEIYIYNSTFLAQRMRIPIEMIWRRRALQLCEQLDSNRNIKIDGLIWHIIMCVPFECCELSRCHNTISQMNRVGTRVNGVPRESKKKPKRSESSIEQIIEIEMDPRNRIRRWAVIVGCITLPTSGTPFFPPRPNKATTVSICWLLWLNQVNRDGRNAFIAVMGDNVCFGDDDSGDTAEWGVYVSVKLIDGIAHTYLVLNGFQKFARTHLFMPF